MFLKEFDLEKGVFDKGFHKFYHYRHGSEEGAFTSIPVIARTSNFNILGVTDMPMVLYCPALLMFNIIYIAGIITDKNNNVTP